MPDQYLAIKKSELAAGKPLKEAERIAAATWNKSHPGHPVGRKENFAAAPSAGVAPIRPSPFDESAPKELKGLYDREYKNHSRSDLSHEEIHRRALRMTQHAGWYKGNKGWKRILPDLRDKVAIREAVRQPDGKYFIDGVYVFYPNAVKGEGLPYSESDIERMIENTNRSILSGSQKPGLTEGHAVPEHHLLGKQIDAHGFGVNWRKDPKGRKGWAMCSLIDVEPEYVQRMKDRKLTGLSAGIAKDSNGLNRRFGHVALLGGASQALSHLPTHEIFSGGSMFFSADTETFPKGRSTMKRLTPKQRECYSAMHTAFEAYAAAEKCNELGEPGAESKMDEAYGAFTSAHSNFMGEINPSSPQELAGGPGAAPDEMGMQQPEPAPQPSGASPEFSADPAAAFAALQDEVKSQQAKFESLQKAHYALIGRQAKQNFDSTVDTLRREGRQLPGNLDALFTSCMDNKNPSKALTTLIESLRSLPPKQTPATAGVEFAAGGNNAVPGRPFPAKTVAKTATVSSIQGLSPEEATFASIGEAISAM
jgi:hypothetical protein